MKLCSLGNWKITPFCWIHRCKFFLWILNSFAVFDMLLPFSSNRNKTLFLKARVQLFNFPDSILKRQISEQIAYFEFFHSVDFRTHSNSNVVLSLLFFWFLNTFEWKRCESFNSSDLLKHFCVLKIQNICPINNGEDKGLDFPCFWIPKLCYWTSCVERYLHAYPGWKIINGYGTGKPSRKKCCESFTIERSGWTCSQSIVPLHFCVGGL